MDLNSDSPSLLADNYRSPHHHHFSTDAIHGGRDESTSAVPIYQGVNNYRSRSEGGYIRGLEDAGGATVEALEDLVKDLEGAEWSLATSSGMAAVGNTLLGLLSSGDRIVVHRCVYYATNRMLHEDLPHKWGIQVEWVDFRNLDALQNALVKPTRLVYFEPYANPSMDLIEAAAVIKLAHEAGALAVVDNTWFSPYLLQPLHLGADVVLHSATKYLGGHGDALSGVISGQETALREDIHRMRLFFGGVLAPLNAYLVIRGIRTLPFRMERHCQNAQKLAEYLAEHPKVAEVRYPGLPTYAANSQAKCQTKGYGGMLGFVMVPGANPERFARSLSLCRPWVSLGDVETLVVPTQANEARGVPLNYVRVSAGLEAAEDIMADFDQALGRA